MAFLQGVPDGARSSYFFDPQVRLRQAVLSLLADNGQTGGLHGLIDRFRAAGLGYLVQSWIGAGHNLPLSVGQVEAVLGNGHLQQISEETGLHVEEAAQHVSEMLPELIDRFTPEGTLPQGGLGDLCSLLEQSITEST